MTSKAVISNCLIFSKQCIILACWHWITVTVSILISLKIKHWSNGWKSISKKADESTLYKNKKLVSKACLDGNFWNWWNLLCFSTRCFYPRTNTHSLAVKSLLHYIIRINLLQYCYASVSSNQAFKFVISTNFKPSISTIIIILFGIAAVTIVESMKILCLLTSCTRWH